MKRISFLTFFVAFTTVADWPQWRGPNRNGVVADGVPLLGTFPKEGLKRLWVSEFIPSNDDGGHGSVVVAGGRVYLALVWHTDVPTKTRAIDDLVLRKLGNRGVTLLGDKLVAKMEADRMGLSSRLRGSKLTEWIDKWVEENLNKEQQQGLASWVASRFKKGKSAIPVKDLQTLATMREHRFEDDAEFKKWLGEQGFSDAVKAQVVKAVPATRKVAKDVVVCLDVISGKTLWKAEAPGEPTGRRSSSTPCVANGRVYAVGGRQAHCVDAVTGKPLWSAVIPGKNVASSFLVAEGKAFVMTGRLVALDANSGKVAWESNDARGGNSSPVLWKDDGKTFLIINAGREVVCLNPADGKLSSGELINVLKHPNKWHRQTAQRLLADRREKSIVPRLTSFMMKGNGQFALECFWAINHSGGFNPRLAEYTLTHSHPFIRHWTIRLLGDDHLMTPSLRTKLVKLAKTETNAEVRSCLAASCKRWAAKDSFPIIAALIRRDEDVNDKHIPLLLWWAIENKAVSDGAQVAKLLADQSIWQTPMMQSHLVKRLGQRFTAERTAANLMTAAKLLALAPTDADRDQLVTGMEEGLRGNAVQNPPKALLAETAKLWKSRPHTPTLISFATRLGLPEAMDEAITLVKNPKTSASERRAMTKLLSERRSANALKLLLGQFKAEKNSSRRIELMTALQRFDSNSVGAALLARYAGMPQRERESAQNILSSRANWSLEFIRAIDAGKIKREDVRPATVLAMQSHKQKAIDVLVKKHWGQLRQSTEAKQQRMTAVAALIAENKGDAKAGKLVFAIACAACHRLRGQGGNIGPNLDAYQLNNPGFLIPAVVDPSLGIREEYAGFNVVTKDNQRLTGFIAQNAPQFIVLRDLAQNSITLPRNEIKDLQAMPVSLMPEGILDALTPQQVRDLFAFLMGK